MGAMLKQHWWVLPALWSTLLLGAVLAGPGLAAVKPVYLWTDQLVYLLVIMALFLVAYIRHRAHLREPWTLVLRRRLAMGAAVILLAYVVIGLLDSVHFRPPLQSDGQGETHYAPQVISVLDLLAEPIRSKVESTYSAPLATHLYSKEAVETPGGRGYVYPRLEHGGAHLQDPFADRSGDIALRALRALIEAAAIWVVLGVLLAWWLARHEPDSALRRYRQMLRGDTRQPWHVFLYTLLAMVALVALAARIGPYYHILGTDKVGQDVFYQAVKSIRTGLVIGTLTTMVMLPFAILLGIAAGFFKGWVDDVIQYMYTTLSSIPGVLLIAAAILSIQVYIVNHPDLFVTAAHRADLRLLALCIILGITSWTSLCRLLRGETLKLGQMDYIEAATAFGVRSFTIIGRHILPNVMHIVLIIVVLDFSGLVLAEAVLSYVGVGVDPSTISWGNMINSARLEMAREPVVWWTLLAAFVFMFTLVLSANVFSDAVRDAFDPRLRQSA